MAKLQILIPMGGLGQRFRDRGYEIPKPLIQVNGQRMFLRALKSFDSFAGDKKVVFVVRKDAEDIYGLATSIGKIMPEAQTVILDHNTRGAAETAMVAINALNFDGPLIIMDCDFDFISKDYFDKVANMISEKTYDGVLLSFKSDNPRYSYARVGGDGFVIETAEKEVISNNALAGAYCFATAGLFEKYAKKLIDSGLSDKRKEFYISYVYSEMLKDGLRVGLADVDSFNSFGTPEELNEYLAAHDD